MIVDDVKSSRVYRFLSLSKCIDGSEVVSHLSLFFFHLIEILTTLHALRITLLNRSSWFEKKTRFLKNNQLTLFIFLWAFSHR